MTLIQEDTITVTTDGDHDKHAHYFRKTDLDRALLEGVTIRALCGKKDRPLSGIDGRQVCPECDAIFHDDERLLGSDV